MRDYIYIGGTPSDEPCAQTGRTAAAGYWNRVECLYYITALRKKYGEEPEGASLRTKAEHHDFGTYYEVICTYDPENEAAVKYALACENGLETWAEVSMTAPVLYDEHSQPIPGSNAPGVAWRD